MTTAEDLKPRILEIIAEHSELPAAELRLDHVLATDLGFDSLEDVELAMDLEDEFEISVPDEELTTIRTVGDVIELVTKYKNAAA